MRLWDGVTGVPIWRCPLFFAGEPPEVFTHLGWRSVDVHGETEAKAKQGEPPGSWRRAVESRARLAAPSADGTRLCLRSHDDDLELWDLSADRNLHGEKMPGLEHVLAPPGGCLALARPGTARWVGEDGTGKQLATDASAIGLFGRSSMGEWSDPDGGPPTPSEEEQLIIAREDEVLRFDLAGGHLGANSIEGTPTAVAFIGKWIVTGNSQGRLQLFPAEGEPKAANMSFEQLPASAVIRLMAGPPGTVIAGFSGGDVGVWHLERGTRLHGFRLHGQAVHLLLQDRVLCAASDLGDTGALDLSIYARPYCEVLQEVWREVPIEWLEGRVVITPPSQDHRCSGAWP